MPKRKIGFYQQQLKRENKEGINNGNDKKWKGIS